MKPFRSAHMLLSLSCFESISSAKSQSNTRIVVTYQRARATYMVHGVRVNSLKFPVVWVRMIHRCALFAYSVLVSRLSMAPHLFLICLGHQSHAPTGDTALTWCHIYDCICVLSIAAYLCYSPSQLSPEPRGAWWRLGLRIGGVQSGPLKLKP